MLLESEISEQSNMQQAIQRKAEEDLQSKEDLFTQQPHENKDPFQLQLVSVNAELNHYSETQAADFRLEKALLVATLSKKKALVQEKYSLPGYSR